MSYYVYMLASKKNGVLHDLYDSIV